MFENSYLYTDNLTELRNSREQMRNYAKMLNKPENAAIRKQIVREQQAGEECPPSFPGCNPPTSSFKHRDIVNDLIEKCMIPGVWSALFWGTSINGPFIVYAVEVVSAIYDTQGNIRVVYVREDTTYPRITKIPMTQIWTLIC